MSKQNDAQTKILSRVRALVERGERVPAADIAALFTVTDTGALARIARIPRERRHGRTAYHTDVLRVEFRGEKPEEIVEHIGSTTSAVALAPVGARVHPEALPAAAQAVARRTDVVIATTAERVETAARAIGCSHADVLRQLRSGAPVIVTGEGAEVFDEGTRSRFASRAVATGTWLAVHRAAHALGMPTMASMTYLTRERPEAFAAHLDAIRQLQDETGGFVCFVPVPVHNRHRDASYLATPTAHQSLRAAAIARIALDNVEHIAIAPALVGAEVAYVALSYGADTIDTTVLPASVRLVEREGPVGLDLPVVEGPPTAAAPAPPASELIASRIVEARFVPVAVSATMTARGRSASNEGVDQALYPGSLPVRPS